MDDSDQDDIEPQEAITAAATLVDEMRSLRVEMAALRTSRRRQGLWITGLAISVAIGVVASALLVIGYVRVNDISKQASRASNSVTVSCLAGNQARANDRDLWGYVLRVSAAQPPTVPLTPAQQQQQAQLREQFQQHLDAATVQRDCSRPGP